MDRGKSRFWDPCYVEAYADEESAKIRTYELGQGIDLNEDDIGCYETIINSSVDPIVNLYDLN